jgi:hypothetical protein
VPSRSGFDREDLFEHGGAHRPPRPLNPKANGALSERHCG